MVLDMFAPRNPAEFYRVLRPTGRALVGPKALDLVGMTPSARHVSHADLNDDGLLPDRATVSVLATAYKLR